MLVLKRCIEAFWSLRGILNRCYCLTSVQGKRAHEFLLRKGIESHNKQPFFMMLSTPACHEPFTPADQYKNVFDDVKAPRNGSFDYYSPVRRQCSLILEFSWLVTVVICYMYTYPLICPIFSFIRWDFH